MYNIYLKKKKKLNPAQQKYSAYDRELLAIYEAVSICPASAGRRR
jgi:hypothetical protein